MQIIGCICILSFLIPENVLSFTRSLRAKSKFVEQRRPEDGDKIIIGTLTQDFMDLLGTGNQRGQIRLELKRLGVVHLRGH